MPVNKKSQIRIACLLRLMKEGRYPNYPMVLKELRRLDEAGVYKLSQKTIQRDVKYLVEELNAPILYDTERKGYYLTDRSWSGVPVTEEVEMDAAVYGAHSQRNPQGNRCTLEQEQRHIGGVRYAQFSRGARFLSDSFSRCVSDCIRSMALAGSHCSQISP